MNEDSLASTISLFENGSIRSATIMTGYPATAGAIDYAKRNQARFSFGLHFNITEGWLQGRGDSNSLTDSARQFQGPVKQRMRALLYQLKQEDIAAEAAYQLSYLFDHGVAVSHLDSHGHLHKFPAVISALRPVLKHFRITKVRRPQSLYDNPRLYSRLLNRYCARAFSGLATTDNFFNTRLHSNDWFERVMHQLPSGTTEIGIHPGSNEAWRVVEAAPFMDGSSTRILQKVGAKLCDYLAYSAT